ncbi:MAG: gephyrin-like molybdotransferase Glp [Alphaproteobacteria bacterium]
MSLLPYEEALARIVAAAPAPQTETVEIEHAAGRVLADTVKAKLTQPPFAASAMDGYALRASDLTEVETPLTLIGTSQAGARFDGKVENSQTVRIFTGAPVPEGADAVVMQENCTADGDTTTIHQQVEAGRNIRPAGGDFTQGDTLLDAGHKISPHDVALAAAANHAHLTIAKPPSIAILSTGDELVRPGETPGPDQIIASNAIGLAALIESWGGEAIDLGLLPDDLGAITQAIAKAQDYDVLLTIGGASVGDHDHVHTALTQAGAEMDFWKVAIKPGKPLMFGALGTKPVLGLPGNPVSAIVVAHLFLKPFMAAMLGSHSTEKKPTARLGANLPANGNRRDHIRATLSINADGSRAVTPLPVQDSAHLRVLAAADALIIREVNAPAARAGDIANILPLFP